jgi:hypothetical protein
MHEEVKECNGTCTEKHIRDIRAINFHYRGEKNNIVAMQVILN